MKLPGMDGAEATRMIRDLNPETKVLVLTSFFEPERVQRAMQAGASGYLIKSSSGDKLVDAIRETHQGRTMLSSEAADALVQRAVAPRPLGYDLTDTQREVLALMVEGLTNSDIGERMYLSPSTVSYHVSEILSKLGASNRAQASALAFRHGLVAE
jgi:NarL family two-component system response regulator LiaR